MSFSYTRDGMVSAAQVATGLSKVSVVDSEREAVASINEEMFRKGWVDHNLGAFTAKFADALSKGDRGAARTTLDAYQSALIAESARTGISLTSPAATRQTQEMERDLSSAFTGDPVADENNQNRFGKKNQLGSRLLMQQSY